MYRRVDWLKPADRQILENISSYSGWIRPATVSLNIDFASGYVSNRCISLSNHGLLERHPDVPAYRLTDLGRAFLADELEPDDLRE